MPTLNEQRAAMSNEKRIERRDFLAGAAAGSTSDISRAIIGAAGWTRSATPFEPEAKDQVEE
jgi:hypothetical protein